MIEEEKEEKQPELNKPKVGGSKKYYVYVKDGDKIKKVSWGDTTGLKVKLDNPEARKSFVARHKCDTKNDKTQAGYWACRLPYYAKQLGLSGGGSFFW
jgi:ABC-type lipoprotein release transport system permease subunit